MVFCIIYGDPQEQSSRSQCVALACPALLGPPQAETIACPAPHYEFGTTVGAKSISTPGGYQEGFLCRLGRSDGSFEQFCCCGVIGGGDSSAASAEELKDDLHA
jgi:hypothetical protein